MISIDDDPGSYDRLRMCGYWQLLAQSHRGRQHHQNKIVRVTVLAASLKHVIDRRQVRRINERRKASNDGLGRRLVGQCYEACIERYGSVVAVLSAVVLHSPFQASDVVTRSDGRKLGRKALNIVGARFSRLLAPGNSALSFFKFIGFEWMYVPARCRGGKAGSRVEKS